MYLQNYVCVSKLFWWNFFILLFFFLQGIRNLAELIREEMKIQNIAEWYDKLKKFPMKKTAFVNISRDYRIVCNRSTFHQIDRLYDDIWAVLSQLNSYYFMYIFYWAESVSIGFFCYAIYNYCYKLFLFCNIYWFFLRKSFHCSLIIFINAGYYFIGRIKSWNYIKI